MIHEVTSCADCPFTGEFDNCYHPSTDWESLANNISKHLYDKTYPEWCPIKKEDIVIKLVKK